MTEGERFYLWRLRQGLSRAEAGRLIWGVRSRAGVAAHPTATGAETLTTFVERDRERLPEGVIPELDPTLPEMLRIARRRSKLDLKGPVGVARLWGVSHPTLLAAERRGERTLARFWVARGLLIETTDDEKSLAA